jgi:hypothetical protein
MTLSSGLSIGGLIGFGTFTSLAAKIGVLLGSAGSQQSQEHIEPAADSPHPDAMP